MQRKTDSDVVVVGDNIVSDNIVSDNIMGDNIISDNLKRTPLYITITVKRKTDSDVVVVGSQKFCGALNLGL